MLSRKLWLPVLLAGGVGLPIAIHQGGGSQAEPMYEAAPAWATAAPGRNFDPLDARALDSGGGVWDPSAAGTAGGWHGTAGVPGLAQLLSFDTTPEQIRQRSAQVSQLITPDGWMALRAPVVTGSQLADLYGSVTYVFDEGFRVERIVLTGRSHHPQPAVDFLAHHFALRPLGADAAGRSDRYVAYRGLTRIGVLRLDRETSATPHHGAVYRLWLEVARPGGRAGLSRESAQMLAGR